MDNQFAYNPDLPFVKEGFKGNKLIKGRFVNEDEKPPVGFSKVFRWLFSTNPQREEKKADKFRLRLKPNPSIFTAAEDAFSWFGHASFLFRLNGKSLLTDPCLHSLPGSKRLAPSPFEFSAIRNLDYILFTHTHRDHFDQRSVRALLEINPDVHFLVP
ncbi:MAG TPA: MBL fold metallo-hydrolase, partial [Bacteroidia bacterium]|nr:MBL fold metallo-hydrolase [Bacteroidia bacterium]